jgi:hypothetical protein
VYRVLGRAAIRFSIRYLRARYRRQIRFGLGIGALAIAVGLAAYLAGRGVPEG